MEAVEEEYGLNDPLIEQYLSYMGNLLKGDLGISYQDPGYIGGRDYRTGSSAYGVARTFGIDRISDRRYGMRGVLCRVGKKGSEKGNRIIRMLAAGIPGFAAAILLLMVFSVKLKWFPSSGLFSFSHYILPVTALSLYPTAVITRMTGHALDEEMAKDYVLFARAKGLKKSRIIFTPCVKKRWVSGIELYRSGIGVSAYGKFCHRERVYDSGIWEESLSCQMQTEIILLFSD